MNAALSIVLALFAIPPSSDSRVERIDGPNFSVEVDAAGVLVAAPSAGLVTNDGPIVHLSSAPTEWFGVSWSEANTRGDVVGTGRRSDWMNRTPLELSKFERVLDHVRSTTKSESLEVETDVSFDAEGSNLIFAVRLANHGDATFENLRYSREWFAAGEIGWTFPPDDSLAPTPHGICRRIWSFGELASGASVELAFSYRLDANEKPAAVDVPLSLWTDASFPTGLTFGQTNGVSWSDYDHDGWPDVFACQARNLWRNVGGQTWTLAANVPLGTPGLMYGSSFADYDQDGFPDFVAEPRYGPTNCMRLMRNEQGTGLFRDIAKVPWLVDVTACKIYSETACWGDVDDDGFLDVFLPVYPPWIINPPATNFFYKNLGPVGHIGQYIFHEMSTQAGLDNPPGTSRPEGAQFADVDDDGDLDLFSNGTLYQNVSTRGSPSFTPLPPTTSGISIFNKLDEGAVFGDYDMDGDLDLFVVYSQTPGVVLWENKGDGTFFQAEAGIIQSPMTGLDLGMSLEDWDNDGDLDLTTRGVFRRNQLMETGTRLFTVATTSIDPTHITSATPAWCDWDHDGDLDCALGNWSSVGHFYRNDLYDASTPAIDRRYVRVRPLRASSTVASGLESEFGARVELHLVTGDDGRRRVKFTASSGGYLNQNDYTLNFGLPTAPSDLEFDVSVDFPVIAERGTLHIDKRVNPALGDIHLATLTDRQIDVFRDGSVRIGGVLHAPIASESPWLSSTGGGLAKAHDDTPLPPLAPTSFPDAWAVLAIGTPNASAPIHLAELDLDAQLDLPTPCGNASFDVALWDVTDPSNPKLADQDRLSLATSPRNDRSHFFTDFVLQPKHEYRLAARVTALRSSTVAGPSDLGGLAFRGSAVVQESSPCTAASIATVAVDPHSLILSARYAQ